MHEPQPNFFIVGAPKCGTTAMWHYLSEHPEVFMPRLKEPHYFAFDITDPLVRGPDLTLEWYRSLFANAGAARVVGEASVLYLFSEVAVREISVSNPDAKLLAMVRNPADLVHSFHNTLVYSGQDTERNFERAWRRRDRRGDNRLLNYGEVGKLGQQLQRLLSHFDRSQVLTVVFDDFRLDPSAEYARVLDFLRLPYHQRSEFVEVNPSRRHKSEIVRLLIEHLPDPAPLKRLLGIQRIGLTAWLKRKNRGRRQLPPLPDYLRAELCEFFADDVMLLSSLLHRDLTHWTKPAQEQSTI